MTPHRVHRPGICRLFDAKPVGLPRGFIEASTVELSQFRVGPRLAGLELQDGCGAIGHGLGVVLNQCSRDQLGRRQWLDRPDDADILQRNQEADRFRRLDVILLPSRQQLAPSGDPVDHGSRHLGVPSILACLPVDAAGLGKAHRLSFQHLLKLPFKVNEGTLLTEVDRRPDECLADDAVEGA
ncbi:hypothetical protein D3C84_861040 [compost metagenome]